MTVKSVIVEGNLTANTERGPSESIWCGQGLPSGYWVNDFIVDPRTGYYFFDDFDRVAPSAALGAAATTGTLGQWALYAYANATVADASQYGGVLTMQCGTTSNQGIALTTMCGAVQIADSTSTPVPGALAFECRIALGQISTAAASVNDVFYGVADKGAPTAGQPITTTSGSLYNSCNLIGFHRVGSIGNDVGFVFQASGVAAVRPPNLQTLITTVTGSAAVAGTYYKLGFVYNPNAQPQLVTATTPGNSTLGINAKPILQVFVNGLPAAAFLGRSDIAASNFPRGYMGPAVAIMNASTATGLNHNVDWVRVAQQAWQ